MGYLADWTALASSGDFDGALELLRGIFHDPKHQARKGSPADYLHEPTDREKTTPAQGFYALVAGFKPRTPLGGKLQFILDRLAEDHVPAMLQRQRAQPLNTLRYKVATYERGSVVADLLHVAADGRAGELGKVLDHEILTDDDCREDYDFTYDLTEANKYKLAYHDEPVDPKTLHLHVKICLFARYLAELTRALMATEVFARLPKVLPFRIEIGENPGYGKRRAVVWYPVIPALDPASLDGHPLATIYLDVAAELATVSPEDRYVSLLGLVDSAEHHYFSRRRDVELQSTELIAFLRAEPMLRTRFTAFAHRHLARATAKLERREPPAAAGIEDPLVRGSVATFAAILWQLADVDRAAAIDFTRGVLALPAPAIDDDLDDCLRTSAAYLESLFTVWRLVSADARGEIADAWQAVVDRLAHIAEPAFRVQWLEQLAADDDHDGDDDPDVRSDGIDIETGAMIELAGMDNPSPAYVTAVVALIERLPEQFHGWAGSFKFVLGRLRKLGPRAVAAVPGVLRLVDRYGSQGDAERTTAELGRVLVALGHDEVPAEIHRRATKQYHNHAFEKFYPAWARRVPTRKVEQMVAAATAAPHEAATPTFWERHLHDSPQGIELAAAVVAADTALVEASETAARAGAGPLLARLIAHRLAAVEKAKRFSELARLLELLPSPTENQMETLRRVRCRLALDALVASAGDASAQIAAVVTADPDQPYPQFLATMLAVERDGGRAAIEPTRRRLGQVAAADPVLAKAVFVYTDTPSEQLSEITEVALYGVYRIAEGLDEAHRRHHDGLFALDLDPLVQALKAIGKGSPSQWTSAWQPFAGELALRGPAGAASVDQVVDQLLDQLDRSDFRRSLYIATRVVKAPTPARVARLLEMFDWFAADKAHRGALFDVLWPLEPHRDQLLQHPAWLAVLDRFIVEYRGPSIEHAKQCFTRLGALGRTDVVLATAAKLDDKIVVGSFKAVMAAFHERGDFAGAEQLTAELLRRIDPARPESVLMASNLAVNQMLTGDRAAAERTFDALFAQDFSRYFEHEDDELMKEVLGTSVDASIVAAFKIYFAGAKFNVACLYALTDRPERAIAALEDAIANAPQNYPAGKLRAESDFAKLAGTPAFEQLLARRDGASR